MPLCPADGRVPIAGDPCNPDPCIVTDVGSGYETTTYVTGHVPGGDHGATYHHYQACTVPTVPPTSPSLPVTGNTNALWQLAAGAIAVLLGWLLIRAARR